MKKSICIFLTCVIVLLSLCSCANGSGAQMKITLDESLPQAAFAAEEIRAAVARCNINNEAGWSVSFNGVDESLGEQGYRIAVEDKKVSITGGDASGLMYGGLEVAEQISLAGSLSGVKETSNAPDMLRRGIKFNAPLDMRTPGYSDMGDSGQENIYYMWDKQFWADYFDDMARNRYNAFTLWNLNPFPSMVKVEDYPDVALDDVWRTTLPLDENYNGTGTNFVTEEHWSNYEVLYKLSIDEKIDFWKEVMACAHDRGIEFYIYTWNIYTYGEHGQYGITNDPRNETTKDYYRKSVAAMVETYPDLDGIGVSSGENMVFEDIDMERDEEQWLWDTYGMGINDALEKNADRAFTLVRIFRFTNPNHASGIYTQDIERLQEFYRDFKGKMECSAMTTIAHALSSPYSTHSDLFFEELPENYPVWLEHRSDDLFYSRWGDPDYAREYLSVISEHSQLKGFLYGPDGYIIGKQFEYKDPDWQGKQSYLEKNWYGMALWGRLGYDMSLTNEFFSDMMVDHFRGAIPEEDARLLAETMAWAGKVTPQIVRSFWNPGDSYYPEMSYSNITSWGYIGVRVWMNGDNVMPVQPGKGCVSIVQYVAALNEGATEFEDQTPDEVAEALALYSAETMLRVERLRANKPAVFENELQEEFYIMVTDQAMLGAMSGYCSEKTWGALNLKFYDTIKDTVYQDKAVKNLENALEYWKTYATEFDSQYLPQFMCHLQSAPSPTELIVKVENDIAVAQKWKPRG